MTNKLEIEINITKTTIERAVFVNGEERYRDCYTLPSFPSDEDPIRALELFLMGEQSKRNSSKKNQRALKSPNKYKGFKNMTLETSQAYYDAYTKRTLEQQEDLNRVYL